jgi:hypothetical protein
MLVPFPCRLRWTNLLPPFVANIEDAQGNTPAREQQYHKHFDERKSAQLDVELSRAYTQYDVQLT